MLHAPIPENEVERLESLKKLNILDTAPEERFDRITRCAQRLFDVPISTISLVDTNREWFKSCQGTDVTKGDRSISFCGHAMLADDLLVIPDTHQDERFKDNPMVVGEPHLRFYAGQSLRGPGAHRIGTFCIKDQKPRNMTDKEKENLKDLAAWVELELNASDLSLALDERNQTLDKLKHNNQELEEMNELMMDREIRMVELKTEINDLCEKLGEKSRYEVQD